MSRMPGGDRWRLRDTDPESQHFGKEFIFDFSGFPAGMKRAVKDYIWNNHARRALTVSRLYDLIKKLKWFSRFAHAEGIERFSFLTNADIDKFLSFLNTSISGRTGKGLSYISRKLCLDALKSVIRWCQVNLPDEAPKKEIFTGNEFRGVNGKLKTDFIPDDELEQVDNALKTEENPYIVCGIMLMKTIGIRIGDLLLLRADCLRKEDISTGHRISFFEHKNRKHRDLPVSRDCAVAVENLIKHTRELRGKCDDKMKDFLFIHMPARGKGANNTHCVITAQSTFNYWIKSFVKRHNITSADGQPGRLTQQMFRRTAATTLCSMGVPINEIQEMMGHSTADVTRRHYAAVKDKTRAELFKGIGVIGEVTARIEDIGESVLPDAGGRRKFLDESETRARLVDGYCLNPYQKNKDRLCDTLCSRNRCYRCPMFITTPEFLGTITGYRDALVAELKENPFYGKHYEDHFVPVIQALNGIISKLEKLKEGKHADANTAAADGLR